MQFRRVASAATNLALAVAVVVATLVGPWWHQPAHDPVPGTPDDTCPARPTSWCPTADED